MHRHLLLNSCKKIGRQGQFWSTIYGCIYPFLLFFGHFSNLSLEFESWEIRMHGGVLVYVLSRPITWYKSRGVISTHLLFTSLTPF